VITTGGSWAKDLDGHRRELGSGLRQIVKAADRSTLVMARRAAVLLPLLDEWTRPWIENGIGACGQPLSFEGFRDLVRDTAARQPEACARLGEVAPLIFRHVPKARGASLSTATVTHALLLMIVREAGHRAAWTCIGKVESSFREGGGFQCQNRRSFSRRSSATKRCA
jgi:hypothetical protein